METQDYALPLLITILLRITYLWYKDSHSETPSKDWTEFYFKFDQDIYFGTIVTMFLYWAIPFEVYLYIAKKLYGQHIDIDPKRLVNFILALVGIFSIQIFQLGEKYIKFIYNKFTNGKSDKTS